MATVEIILGSCYFFPDKQRTPAYFKDTFRQSKKLEKVCLFCFFYFRMSFNIAQGNIRPKQCFFYMLNTVYSPLVGMGDMTIYCWMRDVYQQIFSACFYCRSCKAAAPTWLTAGFFIEATRLDYQQAEEARHGESPATILAGRISSIKELMKKCSATHF